MDCCQAQSPACELRCEEGIEYLRQCFFVHAAARIGNFQANVKSFPQILAAEDGTIRTAAMDGVGGDRYYTAIFTEGLGGIDDEIEDDLMDLRGVRFDHRKFGGQIAVQRCLFGDRHLQHRSHVLDDP